MENTSTSNSATDYLEKQRKQDARLIAIIIVVGMTGFLGLLAYMFFGY